MFGPSKQDITAFSRHTKLPAATCRLMLRMTNNLEDAKASWDKAEEKVEGERERQDEIRGLNNLLTQVQYHMDEKRQNQEEFSVNEIAITLHDMAGIMRKMLKLHE